MTLHLYGLYWNHVQDRPIRKHTENFANVVRDQKKVNNHEWTSAKKCVTRS